MDWAQAKWHVSCGDTQPRVLAHFCQFWLTHIKLPVNSGVQESFKHVGTCEVHHYYWSTRGKGIVRLQELEILRYAHTYIYVLPCLSGGVEGLGQLSMKAL